MRNTCRLRVSITLAVSEKANHAFSCVKTYKEGQRQEIWKIGCCDSAGNEFFES